MGPSSVAQVRQSAERELALANPLPLDAPLPQIADDGEEVAERADEEEDTPAANALPPRAKLALTSSVRAPQKRRNYYMSSVVPQREEEWRFSALGPSLGPGSYASRVKALEVREPMLKSQVFRS